MSFHEWVFNKIEFRGRNLEIVITQYRLFGRICIHIFKSYDDVFHNHPWSYTSLMIWGGYIEHLANTDTGEVVTEPHPVGSVIWRRDKSVFHRLELMKDKAITLCFIGKPTKHPEYWDMEHMKFETMMDILKRDGRSRKQIVDYYREGGVM